ncbi:rhodanese-like domain-containing protein [Paracoccus suum]|uniref:Rhodanese-like domain-containing protein n=1 Tax=Paracoccus suum TaxID=2259340 RepID=A0A344PP26_9RHOB|nr:rhodanese-like domain-containing protein [Paracoccus suum]AXC51131.1 rhodanese-like domain-containing protein [Paracoccus suum]
MAQTAKDMVAAANAAIRKVSAEEAQRLVAEEGALLVDVRDAPELASAGKLKGATHVSRGMLEFKADPTSPYHDADFDPSRPVVLYCASGGRAALAGKALTDLGYTRVYNLGGFKDATEAGAKTEPA